MEDITIALQIADKYIKSLEEENRSLKRELQYFQQQYEAWGIKTLDMNAAMAVTGKSYSEIKKHLIDFGYLKEVDGKLLGNDTYDAVKVRNNRIYFTKSGMQSLIYHYHD